MAWLMWCWMVDVFHIHEVLDAKELLCLFDTGLGQCRGLCFFIDDVVCVDDVVVFLFSVQLFDLVHLQGAGKTVCNLVQVGGLVAAAGDDEWGSRLIDQDGVDLVDDGKIVAALHAVLFVNLTMLSRR